MNQFQPADCETKSSGKIWFTVHFYLNSENGFKLPGNTLMNFDFTENTVEFSNC